MPDRRRAHQSREVDYARAPRGRSDGRRRSERGRRLSLGPGQLPAALPGRAHHTHSAIVFLSGTRAYKLTRAVRYDYLDFSTRELRRVACERAALNRRTAADLYLGVLAITRDSSGRLAFDGTGSPVDHVVHMVRFDQDALFDRLASRGALTIDLMEKLADAVAHVGAPTRANHGGHAGMAWVINGNEEGFREIDDTLDAERCRRVTELARTALDRHGALLESRRTDGHVRECHGDLHLRNIVYRPTYCAVRS